MRILKQKSEKEDFPVKIPKKMQIREAQSNYKTVLVPFIISNLFSIIQSLKVTACKARGGLTLLADFQDLPCE